MTNDELKDYVIDNIDLAIENAYIEPFYQPVIRTITGKLCGFEALARWIDPEYGMISPAIFVPALESVGQIYKLDFYIMERVCKDFVMQKEKSGYAVPFSLNLSRQDFDKCDIAEIIEENVKKYNVPRNILNIEITESCIGKDPEFMKKEIDKLHNLGYSIWMDDFGSEYSSFNVLKDFDVDVLKIDMKFIASDEIKAKKIVMSIVDMAKKIGIKTLAEGVETNTQYEFLRNIGCEKIQGYFFGKPMSLEDTTDFFDNYSNGVELPYESHYYDKIGSVNILSPATFMGYNAEEFDELGFNTQIPITIAEMKNNKLDFIFYNQSFETQLKSFGVNSMEILKLIVNDKESSYYRKIMDIFKLADQLEETYASGNFIIDDKLCIAKVYKLETCNEQTAYVCILVNMVNDQEYLNKITKEKYIKAIFNKYDRVDVFDLTKLIDTEIYVNDQNIYNYDGRDIHSNMEKYVVDRVYYEDADRYMKFFDMATLRKRIQNSKERIITSYIRLKEGNDYVWKVLECNYLGNNKVVATARNASDSELKYAPYLVKKVNVTDINSYEASFNQVNSNVICYWKDLELRYTDATKGYINFYGIESLEVILNKTDTDLNWVEDSIVAKKEKEVLKTGIKTSLVETVTVNNEAKVLVIDLSPIYDNGKIIGLMGYITDIYGQVNLEESTLFIDDYSGTLNTKGLMSEVNKFSDEFLLNNKKYAVLIVDIKDFKYAVKNYGKFFARDILNVIGKKLVDIVGVKGVVGRIETDHFMILTRYKVESELKELKEKLLLEINKINKISNKSFTIDAYIEYTTCLEDDTTEKLIGRTMNRIAQIKSKNRNGE